MKTNQLILAVVALAVFASCSNDSFNVKQNVDNEIGFNAVTRMATRANDAIITGATYATDNTFQVWGWQSQAGDFSELADNAASNFMSNLTIQWTKGRDNTRDLAWRNEANYYYWPYTGKISFLAIHPSTVAPTSTGWDATNDKPTATKTGYTISESNKTTDLMFATAEGVRRTTALPLVFKHALSQIQFRVRTDYDYTLDEVEFKVDSVFIHSIDLSGDVAYANEAFTWTNNSNQVENWYYYRGTQVVNYYDADADAETYGDAVLMVPQPANIKADELDPGDANYDADDHVQTTLTIGYTMKQKNNATISGTVTVAAPQTWEAGSRYLYTLCFRLNEIIFDPQVTNWVSVDVATINVIE